MFNWCKAFADYTLGFLMDGGITVRVPEALEAIAPAIYQRVWENDNDKASVLHEIAQLGAVSGDVFIKVAYEDAFADPAGALHDGRVRIMPLNPAHCFPEFHGHDRERMQRFKLKYRFWGTTAEGTRQVFTYTEIITEAMIEEYVNDECIRQEPNVLGVLPIVHIPNQTVASSPWGLSDIQDIINLNRQYNEVACEIADIINYYGSPVTIIKGAKASNLERGPRKVWGGLPKDADVFNLKSEADIGGAMAYLEQLKRSMHELTGVPEGALGQMQPASNTAGVALHMLYLPLVRRNNRKQVNYGKGLCKVNELIMRTIALKEPHMLVFNPMNGLQLRPDQYAVLDPSDAATYRTEIHWPDPLPMDRLLKLNELQLEMELGLESRIGALRELGNDRPVEKLREIYEEQRDDAQLQGALDLVRQAMAGITAGATGFGPDGSPVQQQTNEMGQPVGMSPAMAMGLQTGVPQQWAQQTVQDAFGEDPPERLPDTD